MKSWALVPVLALVAVGVVAPQAQAAAGAPVLAAAASFPVVQGSSGPVGDLVLTESTPGQFQVGDVLVYRFADAGAATLHFSTAGTVSGTNGLAATVVTASSSGTLNDEMKVTITASSSGSFPGVLTLAGLTAAVDGTAVAGAVSVTVTDSNVATPSPSPSSVSDAQVITSGTSRAIYSATSTPTVLSTTNSQDVGSVTITEPAKDFFKTGDVITFTVRDANGSADTVGLAGTPLAAGGSMTVAVTGSSGPSVQVNDTSFGVTVAAQDPANGSTSTLTVSNIVVNTAQAPIGPVTLAAVVTTGGGASTELIAPGRVVVANVGGNTSTTSTGHPALTIGATSQVAADVNVSIAAGSLLHADTFSLALQPAGVTFTATSPPVATVTSGSLTLSSATAVLSPDGTVATWTVQTANSTASTVAIGPITYDVGPAVAAGTPVSLLASGETGSAFTSQVVTDAVVAPAQSVGAFTAAQPVPVVGAAPFAGSTVTYTEVAAGSTPVGSSLVLISPYATQIAAYRTTFAAVPTVSGATHGLTLGAPTVNSSAMVVSTPDGPITAPAQTVISIPVTAASSGGAGTATISGIVVTPGSLVSPGALVLAGVVRSGAGAALDGNQVVDLVDTHNLGTSSATTPPDVSLTQVPNAVTGLDYATFAFVSDQGGTTFACALDGHVVSLMCASPITVAGLATGSHTFTVQGFNASSIASVAVSYTWTVDTTPPTAAVTLPTTVTAPVVVTFSKPVTQLSTSTVTLGSVPSGATAPTPMAVTLACVAGSAAPVACDPSAAYTQVRVSSVTALVPGQHYVLTLDPTGVVPAIADLAGNVLATVARSFRGPQTLQENAAGTTPTWKSVSASAASGGSYVVSHTAGSAATFSFTGTSVSWQTVTGPAQGQAAVYVDGALTLSVDNYASSTHFGVLRTVSGLAPGSHVLRVVVKGVKGSTAGTDTQVSVDAFVVGTTRSQQTAASYAWKRVAASSASGGGYGVDDLAGASYSMTFRGTSVTWWTVYGPSMGKASVYLDGVLKGTYSNYSASLAYGRARAVTGLSDAVHTLRIVVLGTHAAGASGNAVVVDRLTVG